MEVADLQDDRDDGGVGRLPAILEMRRLDPDGQEHGPDAYVFGNALGERGEYTTVNDAWQVAVARAQITGLHFHDLRREAAVPTPGGRRP